MKSHAKSRRRRIPPEILKYADLILHNGKIITVDEKFTIAKGLAIRDGKFLAVGSDANVLSLAGPDTRLIDLNGNTVIPGLIDSHNHLTLVGLGLVLPSLQGITSIAEIVEIIREAVKKAKPGEPIITAMVSSTVLKEGVKEKRFINRFDLDPVSPENPVCISGSHACVVNSYALRLANITKDTPDPVGGRIEKDPVTGEPTGVFHEAPAMGRVLKLFPIKFEDRVNAIKEVCKKYNSEGLTSIIQHGVEFDELMAYQRVWSMNDLTVRSYVHVWIDYPEAKSLDEDLTIIKHLGFAACPGFGDAMLKIGGIKMIMEDVVTGEQVIPTDKFKQIVLLAAKMNLRVAVHAGDRQINTVLDVYEQVNEEVPIVDKRFVLHACSTPTRETMERVKRLGMVVVTEPLFLYTLGAEWAKRTEDLGEAFPLRDWLDSGIAVALASDPPVNPTNPLLGIWFALTRKDRMTGDIIGPDQLITRQEALRMYTIHGARISFEEDIKGSIEPGKLADLVVLNDDILTCPVDHIKDIKVLMTVVAGKIVYDARVKQLGIIQHSASVTPSL